MRGGKKRNIERREESGRVRMLLKEDEDMTLVAIIEVFFIIGIETE